MKLPIAMLACLAALSAQASIVNGDFENPDVSAGVFTDGGIVGWSANSTAGVWHVNSTTYFNTGSFAPSGFQTGYLNGNFLGQQTSFTVVEGQNELSWFMGRRNDGFAGNSTISMFAGGTVTNGQSSGGTLMVSESVVNTSLTVGEWTPFTMNYTALTGDPLIGQLISIQIQKTSGTQINFDGFVYNSVPEPGTLAVLGLGLLAARRRQR